jgi:hypothetical protein
MREYQFEIAPRNPDEKNSLATRQSYHNQSANHSFSVANIPGCCRILCFQRGLSVRAVRLGLTTSTE